MSEFFKKREKSRKAKQEWLNRFKDNLERALRDIDKHHERKLLTFQVVALALIGAFFINLLTSVAYDLSTSLVSPITTQRINLDWSIVLISLTSLVIISLLLYVQFKKYKPPQPFLSLVIKPEDIKPFSEPSEFKQINDCLEKGMLKDFKIFGEGLFESLHGWFHLMFNDKVDKTPKKEHEEYDDMSRKEFPSMTKEYDLSAISATGVKITLEVHLSPNVIYSWGRRVDESASRSFYLIYRFRILNPEHCDASKFLQEFFYISASDIIEFSSIAIRSAFKKIGCVKPPKAIKNSMSKEKVKP